MAHLGIAYIFAPGDDVLEAEMPVDALANSSTVWSVTRRRIGSAGGDVRINGGLSDDPRRAVRGRGPS